MTEAVMTAKGKTSSHFPFWLCPILILLCIWSSCMARLICSVDYLGIKHNWFDFSLPLQTWMWIFKPCLRSCKIVSKQQPVLSHHLDNVLGSIICYWIYSVYSFCVFITSWNTVINTVFEKLKAVLFLVVHLIFFSFQAIQCLSNYLGSRTGPLRYSASLTAAWS